MALFTSRREKRLWSWTLAVVVAIYSTLGLAGTLVGILPERVLVIPFFSAMFLIGLTVLTQGLKKRPGGAEIGVGLGVAAVYLLLIIRMNITVAERTHLMEYSVVALLIHEALMERASQGRRVPVPGLLAIAAGSLIGVFDECIQSLIPNRVFDPIDILFNVLAAVMAVLASLALAWARRSGKNLFSRPKSSKE